MCERVGWVFLKIAERRTRREFPLYFFPFTCSLKKKECKEVLFSDARHVKKYECHTSSSVLVELMIKIRKCGTISC